LYHVGFFGDGTTQCRLVTMSQNVKQPSITKEQTTIQWCRVTW